MEIGAEKHRATKPHVLRLSRCWILAIQTPTPARTETPTPACTAQTPHVRNKYKVFGQHIPSKTRYCPMSPLCSEPDKPLYLQSTPVNSLSLGVSSSPAPHFHPKRLQTFQNGAVTTKINK